MYKGLLVFFGNVINLVDSVRQYVLYGMQALFDRLDASWHVDNQCILVRNARFVSAQTRKLSLFQSILHHLINDAVAFLRYELFCNFGRYVPLTKASASSRYY